MPVSSTQIVVGSVVGIGLVKGMLTYQKGLALRKMTQNSFNANEDFEKFINTIFKLIEIKK